MWNGLQSSCFIFTINVEIIFFREVSYAASCCGWLIFLSIWAKYLSWIPAALQTYRCNTFILVQKCPLNNMCSSHMWIASILKQEVLFVHNNASSYAIWHLSTKHYLTSLKVFNRYGILYVVFIFLFYNKAISIVCS